MKISTTAAQGTHFTHGCWIRSDTEPYLRSSESIQFIQIKRPSEIVRRIFVNGRLQVELCAYTHPIKHVGHVETIGTTFAYTQLIFARFLAIVAYALIVTQ